MRLGPVAAVAACALGACASGDGVLIDVVDDGTAGPIGAIDVWVGEPRSLGPGRFIRLPRDGDVQAVSEWPFELLIEPDGNGPRPVWVGAFGYTDLGAVGGPPIAVGALAAPIDIVPGQLVRTTITLSAYDAPDADCLFVPGDGDSPPRAILPPDVTPAGLDCDDDGDAETDCDDLDPLIHAGAVESCDGIDNNCDGVCDDGLDADHDGYSACTYAGCGPPMCVDGSEPATDVAASCDCDDSNPLTSPNGVEASASCDGNDSDCDPSTGNQTMGTGEVAGNQIDDDCDGICDVDTDGDRIATGVIGDPLSLGSWSTTCDEALADCADGDPEVYPNALERCDHADNDCSDTPVLIDGPCFVRDPNGCELGARTCADGPGGLGWEPCIPGGEVIAGEDECTDWDVVADTDWPEQAYFQRVGDDERDRCTLVAWRPADIDGTRVNRLCGPSQQPVAHLHPRFRFEDSCQTRIAGGGQRGGYHLALADRATGVRGEVVDGCDVDLVITGISGLDASEVRLPAIWVLIVQQRLSGGGDPETTVLPVEIRVEYTNDTTAFACGPGPWFSCD